MFALKKVLSLIVGGEDPSNEILSLDDAYNIVDAPSTFNLERQDEEPEINNRSPIEEVANYEISSKTGKITQIINNSYTIDNAYTFSSDWNNLLIGTKVSYQLIKSCGVLEVINVNVVENDWDVVDDSKRNWCERTVVCTVSRRDGRELTLMPGKINVNLNTISSEFIPIVGDWVELDVKCEIDETVVDLSGKILEVNKLAPLRPQVKTGRVTQWDPSSQTGVIDKNTFFRKEALCSGYVPIEGEQVVVEIIESNQGACVWRALKIIPDYLHVRKKGVNTLAAEEDLQDSYPGLNITDNVVLTFEKLGVKKSFMLDIENKCNENLTLLSAEFPKINGQCRVVNEIVKRALEANKTFTVKCECTAKHIGETKEVLIFNFDTFKIKRWISLNVNGFKAPRNHVSRYKKDAPIVDRPKREVIRGQMFNSAPRFIPLRIPEYQVPQRMLDLVKKHHGRGQNVTLTQEMTVMKPVLPKALSYMNYEDKFHTLIHLDEINTILAMRNYDQDKACFIPNGEYLLLEIDNLAERRPSIIVGDRVMARDIYNEKSPEYEGFIHKVGKQHVFVKFSQVFHDSYNGEDYSISIIASRTTYKREHYAITLAARNLSKDVLFPTKVVEKEPQLQFIFENYFDEIYHLKALSEPDDPKPKGRNSIGKQEILEKIRKFQVSNEEEVTVLKLEWYNTSLNYYQKEAVRNILLGVCRPLPYMVFGPPGTGKTVTLVEAVLQILRMMPHSRILVAAPSNSAADLLAVRLIDSGVLKPGDIVRLVSLTFSANISAKLAPYAATASFERDGTETSEPFVTSTGLTLGCNSSVLGRHRITVSTCSTAGTLYAMGFPKGHFTHIVVDEAGQTTEPSVMIPLAFLDVSSGQAILAGDPMQLGPVILSQIAQDFGLEESFLERMINRFPFTRDPEGFPKSCGYDPRLITKLIYNYRSLPVLLKLPSVLFYNDDLIPTISGTNSEEAALVKKTCDLLPKTRKGEPSSLIFHGCTGENFQTEDSPSWFNPAEAAQVFYYVNELYRRGLKATDIGIITPYKAQTKQLIELLKEAEFDIPKIGTVEDFQGQEFNVIILSTVRSSQKYVETDILHKMGFVANPRRLNVSITRAKALLIIVGNPHLLSVDRFWRSVINYCSEKGSYVGCVFNSRV